MADDGMLLNFELGSGPWKPQVKFKGGRWRDRKRAERTARAASSGRQPAQPLSRNADGDEEPAKRRKLAGGFSGRPGSHAAQSSSQVRASQDDEGQVRHVSAAHAHGRQPAGSRGPRQVVSRLFTYNPEQRTELGGEGEWDRPEPTNAPLADVASFGLLTLSARLVQELVRMNVERPTAIQSKVIPHMLSTDTDAFVQAETGSGKTLSYLLPVLHRVLRLSEGTSGAQIHRNSGIFAIVVAPTRELAKQTHVVLEQLIRPFPWLVSTAITGGESKKAEKARIRKGVNFLVATPGRLADHIDNTKALSLTTVRWLILDEGDRLMDLGFEEDLQKAIAALRKVPHAKKTQDGVPLDPLPDRRVSVLCSATMKMNVQKLGEMSLAEATFLAAAAGDGDQSDGQAALKAPAQLHQSHIIVPSKLRLVTLVSFLRSTYSRRGRTMKAIVFMSCADSVDFHYDLLRDPKASEAHPPISGHEEHTSKTVSNAAYMTTSASPVVVLHRMHGSLSQPVRTATLKSFASCKVPSLLITTDVSSRGLDIPSVDLVVEYDPAFSFDDHIHRVGRTARAGRGGDALLFLLPGCEEGYLDLLKTPTPPTPVSYESVMRTGLLAKLEFPTETAATPSDGQSYHDKAETLQLHFEQRILNEPKRLELARNGFKSHVRAYATHVREEREHFDITELHLGHVAKSFGLRETPAGIGAGIERKARKTAQDRGGSGKEGNHKEGKPARDVIKQKSMMLMNAADEFNIG